MLFCDDVKVKSVKYFKKSPLLSLLNCNGALSLRSGASEMNGVASEAVKRETCRISDVLLANGLKPSF